MPAVTAEDHLDWAARVVARPVARKYRLKGQEAEDVVQAAVLKLLELVKGKRFDVSRVPEGGDIRAAFRGWAYRWVRCEAVREALRIRGGGLFHTVRPENLVIVDPLGEGAEGVVEYDLATADLSTDGSTRVVLVDAKNKSRYGRRIALTDERRKPPPGDCIPSVDNAVRVLEGKDS